MLFHLRKKNQDRIKKNRNEDIGAELNIFSSFSCCRVNKFRKLKKRVVCTIHKIDIPRKSSSRYLYLRNCCPEWFNCGLNYDSNRVTRAPLAQGGHAHLEWRHLRPDFTYRYLCPTKSGSHTLCVCGTTKTPDSAPRGIQNRTQASGCLTDECEYTHVWPAVQPTERSLFIFLKPCAHTQRNSSSKSMKFMAFF